MRPTDFARLFLGFAGLTARSLGLSDRPRALAKHLSGLLVVVPLAVSIPCQKSEAWIVFGSFRGGDYSSSIHAVRFDGTGEYRISKHDSGRPNCVDPRVSPDGERILFGRGGGGSHRTGVVSMKSDGSDEQVLTKKVMTRFRGGRLTPSYSPRGDRIAYVADVGKDRKIFIAKADGTEPEELCQGEHAWWSPVDDVIVFVRPVEGLSHIWTVRVDGGEPVCLTKGPSSGIPSWSADGERILFSRQVEMQTDLFLMERDGSDVKQLTTTQKVSERNATMSPDEKWIAFVAKTGKGPNGWEKSVYVMPAGGGEAKQVSPARYNDTMPTWWMRTTRTK